MPQTVDGQLVTREERAFVDSILLAGEAGQDGSSFGDDPGIGTEPQKTVKINQLSFNENGECRCIRSCPEVLPHG